MLVGGIVVELDAGNPEPIQPVYKFNLRSHTGDLMVLATKWQGTAMCKDHVDTATIAEVRSTIFHAASDVGRNK